MKLLFKLMLTLLVLAAALPFTPFMPGGKPLFSLGNLKWPKLETPELPALPALKPAGGSPASNNQTFYKWQDAKGNLHFSDKPPKDNTAHLETVEVNPNTNLIPAVKAPPPPQPQQNPAQETTATGLASPYSPAQVKRLFDEANKIKQQSEQRNKQLEELIGRAK